MKVGSSIIAFLGLMAVCSCSAPKSEMSTLVNNSLQIATVQSKLMAENLLNEEEKLPRTIGKDGKLMTSKAKWWTSGFFPGVLWYLYEVNQDDSLKMYAENYTKRIENEKYTTDNHDVGFMLYCSFGNGLRLTSNDEYKQVLLQGAESLSTRFRPQVGCIRSWDWNQKVWEYPVIIDNMMNLEMLMWASKNSDNPKFAEIAKSHADVTMKHHFRPDYSSYHVISYATIYDYGDKEQKKQSVLDRAYNILEQLPASLLKVRLLTYCYGEIYEEGLLQEAHSIMDKWDKGTLTSEQAEVMEELKNIEENQYPFEILQ